MRSASSYFTYFAYGSNLDPLQMQERCPGHRVLGAAWLPDYGLCFPRHSPRRRCATAGLIAGGEGVWGALYEMTQQDVASLHECEGHWPDGPPQHNRHTVIDLDVRHGGPGGTPMSAFTYLAVFDDSKALPSPAYMGHLIRGAAHHGLPETYIAVLQSIVTEEPA